MDKYDEAKGKIIFSKKKGKLKVIASNFKINFYQTSIWDS